MKKNEMLSFRKINSPLSKVNFVESEEDDFFAVMLRPNRRSNQRTSEFKRKTFPKRKFVKEGFEN